MKIIATSASGIESVTAQELKKMNAKDLRTENGYNSFEGNFKDALKANINLRTADRIKIELFSFKSSDFDDLYNKIYDFNWSNFLNINSKINIKSKSINSKLSSEQKIQGITKKAIVDNLNKKFNKSGLLSENGKVFPIEVSFKKDHARVLLDTSGEALFKRGYRLEAVEAPLKETLAAAMVLLTNWNKEMTLLDPTTGSGTIPIEAALIGKNIAPGMNRSFLMEEWGFLTDEEIEEVRDEAFNNANFDQELKIFGFDINKNAIEIAQKNINRVGLSNDINLKQMAVKDIPDDFLSDNSGVIISNPPYGKRLGNEFKSHEIYKEFTKIFLDKKNWSKYFLTDDLNFPSIFGAPATKKRKLYNGSIRTDFFQYWRGK